MILKILHWEQEGLPASELTLEDNNFLIRGYKKHDPIECDCKYLPKYKDCESDGVFLSVTHKGQQYVFQEAYLMNNDGKTIQKYG